VVENRAAHPCSPSNVHPIEPDRLLHLSLHMTPTIFATRGATGREARPDASRLEGRGLEVAGSYEKFEAAGSGRLRRLPS
jgi:hypothetical protein